MLKRARSTSSCGSIPIGNLAGLQGVKEVAIIPQFD
jgi:hypothetical protein